MVDRVNVIGNGKSAMMFDQDNPGLNIVCNLPPIQMKKVYASVMVDFKMMRAIAEGSVQVPFMWVLGARPKLFTEQQSGFFIQYAKQIREFHLDLPKYVANYTDFNCGHMATHYGLKKFAPEEMHLYGFNSMFDFDLTSSTDMFLESDRGAVNNTRLTNNWRNIWPQLFSEFPDTLFHLYHKHKNIKFNLPDNVVIITK